MSRGKGKGKQAKADKITQAEFGAVSHYEGEDLREWYKHDRTKAKHRAGLIKDLQGLIALIRARKVGAAYIVYARTNSALALRVMGTQYQGIQLYLESFFRVAQGLRLPWPHLLHQLAGWAASRAPKDVAPVPDIAPVSLDEVGQAKSLIEEGVSEVAIQALMNVIKGIHEGQITGYVLTLDTAEGGSSFANFSSRELLLESALFSLHALAQKCQTGFVQVWSLASLWYEAWSEEIQKKLFVADEDLPRDEPKEQPN